MALCRKLVAGIAWLRITVVVWAGDLRGIEGNGNIFGLIKCRSHRRRVHALVMGGFVMKGYEVDVILASSSGVPAFALAVNALCKAGGNALPRFSARCRMP
jgi:hypothetical protein